MRGTTSSRMLTCKEPPHKPWTICIVIQVLCIVWKLSLLSLSLAVHVQVNLPDTACCHHWPGSCHWHVLSLWAPFQVYRFQHVCCKLNNVEKKIWVDQSRPSTKIALKQEWMAYTFKAFIPTCCLCHVEINSEHSLFWVRTFIDGDMSMWYSMVSFNLTILTVQNRWTNNSTQSIVMLWLSWSLSQAGLVCKKPKHHNRLCTIVYYTYFELLK